MRLGRRQRGRGNALAMSAAAWAAEARSCVINHAPPEAMPGFGAPRPEADNGQGVPLAEVFEELRRKYPSPRAAAKNRAMTREAVGT